MLMSASPGRAAAPVERSQLRGHRQRSPNSAAPSHAHKSPRSAHRKTSGALQPTHELPREFHAGDLPSDMNGHRDLARGCFGWINFPRAIESARHFGAEINIHRRIAVGGVTVQEDVVSVGAKARLATQKLPNLIQGRTPCRPNRPKCDLPSNGGQFPCWHTLNRYRGGHPFSLTLH